MSQLNQIIASILSDINEAKSKADFASRDLAQAYASDEILKYFPVPKIGISNLEVEIKYAVESVEEKPIESSQSQQRLADFIKNFSENTAREIRTSIAKEALSNVLYKSLGSEYPSKSWEENLSKNLQESFTKSLSGGSDLNRNLASANDQIKKNIGEFFPVAFKSESLATIPISTGEYQVVGLTKSGTFDFVVKDVFADEKIAMNVAKSLSTAISSNKLEIIEAKRDLGTKMDIAKVKAGNQEIILETESKTVGTIQPKAFFENTVKEKRAVLNTPIRTLPSWVLGNPAPVGTRPNAPVEKPETLKEDVTLKSISESILQKNLPDLRSGLDKIINETKTTTLKLSVESDKLKQVKPENVSTIKFTLVGNDFTMIQDEGQKSIL
ncbi:hypothetical protein [Algoriphagus sp.]|uniref:hypothetical protein n=1 Tax=Algoriphagus sp. TaxID=1872435 RepID=UPI00391CDA78